MLCKKVGKRVAVLMLAAGMLLGATSPSQAIEFKAQGEWLVGFGVGDSNLIAKEGGNRTNADDKFAAAQRIRLQLDAVASENLSGTVYFEIGDQTWGKAEEGGALGADGNNVVKVKNAYLDWTVPSTDLSFRMGLQAMVLPNAAGGSAIMDGDVAAINANYKFNDNVGLSAFWMRPVNDNFASDNNADRSGMRNNKGFLDNIDFFGVSVPLTFDGVEVTPWAMYGVMGKNALEGYDGNDLNRPRWEVRADDDKWGTEDGMLAHSLLGWHPGMNVVDGTLRKSANPYTSMFFVGLPIAVTAFDPLNIEFDFNYGYVGGYGSYDVVKADGSVKAADTLRSGWLVKALVEYKMDWGTPGIFGWYGSGDDGNPGNGSERMPSVAGCAGFTSFISEANMDFAPNGSWIDRNLTLAGTWGVGAQIADVSFVEDLNHTLRVAYWGGTNSPTMAKYMNSRSAWNMESPDGPYLTTNDGLLEFNLVNEYKIYENLTANVELGYVVNMIDKSTWKKAGGDTNERQDAWKAQVIFAYSF